jgi:hypothetical protein
MGRKDPRRALLLRVPFALRRAIAAQHPGPRPLAAKLRVVLRRALAQGLTPLPVAPGTLRPSLLQLSAAERAGLAAFGPDLEAAALGLIAATLEAGK